MGEAAGIPRPQPGRRGAGVDRAGRDRARRHDGDRRISRRGLSREDPDRHQPGRPRRGAAPDRLVRHQDEPRGDREFARRKDDEAADRPSASRTRWRFAPGTPTSPITSIISAISSSAGAGSPAIISRSPTSPPRRSCRASIISATFRGMRTSRPRNGMRGSSRARASARSWPITSPASRRPSTTPTSIFEKLRVGPLRASGARVQLALSPPLLQRREGGAWRMEDALPDRRAHAHAEGARR